MRNRALAEGFDLIGIAEAGPAETAPHLRQWLADGMQAQMSYMASTAVQRSHP